MLYCFLFSESSTISCGWLNMTMDDGSRTIKSEKCTTIRKKWNRKGKAKASME